MRVRAGLIERGKATEATRILAHPDLQEVSNAPCDTGSPLDVLREEFPSVEFLDEHFPADYPRSAHIKPKKKDTEYDDVPTLLAARAKRFRKYLKEGLSETEILIVTHGSFAHFLFNRWDGEPGKSRSCGTQLHHGHASFATLPGPGLPGEDMKVFRGYAGPGYPVSLDFLDYSPQVADYGVRDCGIFTKDKMRYARASARNQSNITGLSRWG